VSFSFCILLLDVIFILLVHRRTLMLATLRTRELSYRWARLIAAYLERATRWFSFEVTDRLEIQYAFDDQLARQED